MKKLLALLIALCMALSVCAALAEETPALKDARQYVNMMYKNKPASTPKDYELIGSVPTDGDPFTVEWSTDADSIVVTREENGLVKIDVDEDNSKEVVYKLTATIKDAEGNETSVTFDRFVPASIKLDVMTEEEIVQVAYTLEDQATLPAFTALCGDIVAIPSEYSEQYGNITVNIQVGDLTDQPIQCYRLKGEGIADLKVGDHIAVFGLIKNYKSTIEFDAGCVLIPEDSCQSARVAGFAYTLEPDAAMTRASTLTGVVTSIPSAYSEEYKNITVNLDVPGLEGYTVQCYRLVGEGAADLAEGDTITVTGTIKNYKGTIEFDKGCVIDAVIKATTIAEEPAVEEPAVEEPAVEEPAVEEPAVEEPAVEEPAVEEPAVEEPAVEEPAVEEPAVEEPAVEEPAVEEPAVEEPAAEQKPGVRIIEAPIEGIDFSGKESSTKKSAAEEPAVEEPAVEEPAVEEPAIEEPAAEEPAAEQKPGIRIIDAPINGIDFGNK